VGESVPEFAGMTHQSLALKGAEVGKGVAAQ